MKVVILAGGLGTRLPEYTHSIPKPMVKIKNKPISLVIFKNLKKFKNLIRWKCLSRASLSLSLSLRRALSSRRSLAPGEGTGGGRRRSVSVLWAGALACAFTAHSVPKAIFDQPFPLMN